MNILVHVAVLSGVKLYEIVAVIGPPEMLLRNTNFCANVDSPFQPDNVEVYLHELNPCASATMLPFWTSSSGAPYADKANKAEESAAAMEMFFIF